MARSRGRPRSDIETEPISVRLPKATLQELDRFLDLLEVRTGKKSSRSTIAKEALTEYLSKRLPKAPELPKLNA